MNPLDIAALVVIFIIIVVIAVIIVLLGTLPGKIARNRGHPYPSAVDAASWIGLATGVFWPVAFIWSFLPVPRGAAAQAELAELRQRVEALEAAASQVPAGGSPP